MAVVIIMIKTVTKMKANATEQQQNPPKKSEKKQNKRATKMVEKKQQIQPDVQHKVKTMDTHIPV